MNNYPIWWDTTLTIFNKYQDPQTQLIKWFKTVVDGAFWKYTGDQVTINDTVIDTNIIKCRIRKDDRFLEKHLWVAKPNDEMENYFTLGQGDIIIKGIVDETINEYKSGLRSSDIIAKYKQLQGCMTVQAVAINCGAGRYDEHYLVKGI